MRRADVTAAVRGRSLTLWGAFRELRKLPEYLYDGEVVDDVAACTFGTTGGRSIMVATNERLLFLKDGWVYKNSQNIAYEAIDSVNIRTKLFFSTVSFVARGETIAVVDKVGRFSAKHFCDLVRNRTGHRFATWKAQEQAAAQQQLQAQQMQPVPTMPQNPAGNTFNQNAPSQQGSFLSAQPVDFSRLAPMAAPQRVAPPSAPVPHNPLAFTPPVDVNPAPRTGSIPIQRPVSPFRTQEPKTVISSSPIIKPGSAHTQRSVTGRLIGNPLESFRVKNGYTY